MLLITRYSGGIYMGNHSILRHSIPMWHKISRIRTIKLFANILPSRIAI